MLFVINRLDAIMSEGRLVTIQIVHGIFLSVVVAEGEVEDDSGDKGRDGHTSVHPHKFGIDSNGDQSLRDGRAESVGEEVDALDKRLHARRGLGVGVLETSDGDENLRKTDEEVGGDLYGNVNVVGQRGVAVLASGALPGGIEARAGSVDDVLNDGGIGEAQGGKGEADGDAHDGLELDAHPAEHGIDELVEDGGEDEDGDGVKVLHKVVGHAVALHLAGLGDEVCGELAVADPEDGVEDKDLAGAEGALELLDEVVVPGDDLGLAVGGAPRGLGGVEVAGGNHHAEGLEGVGNDGALGRAVDVGLAAEHEHGDAHVEHAEAHEVGGPEALVLFHEGRGHERQGAQVDAPVEDHVDALVRNGRVDDDTLTRLGIRLDGHDAPLVLIRDERRNIRLDAARAKADDDDGHNVTWHAGAGFQRRRQRGCP